MIYSMSAAVIITLTDPVCLGGLHIVKLPALSALEQKPGVSVQTSCTGLCFSISTGYSWTTSLLLSPHSQAKWPQNHCNG